MVVLVVVTKETKEMDAVQESEDHVPSEGDVEETLEELVCLGKESLRDEVETTRGKNSYVRKLDLLHMERGTISLLISVAGMFTFARKLFVFFCTAQLNRLRREMEEVPTIGANKRTYQSEHHS